MAKVSIIVPVYNSEKYLNKCLDSLVNQTLDNIEIIIVNDGSNDNSQDIINDYINKYPKKIVSLIKENGGLSSARNYGLLHTTGEYIGFVDSDDFVDINMYKSMYELALKENLDLVECDFSWLYSTKSKKDIGTKYVSKQSFFVNGRVMACNKLFRASIIQKYNILFPINLRYEDIPFFYELIPYIKKSNIISKPFYNYVQRENSIANLQNEKNRDIFTVLENILNFYKGKNLYNDYKDELEYIYIRFLLGSSFLRIAKIKNKTLKKSLLNMTWEELNTKFPNWKKNKILKTIKSKKNFYYKTINKFTYRIYSIIF